MKIGIDARFVGPQGTGLGKYTEKLIENLQKIDQKNLYSIFLKEDNWNHLNLQSKNFKKVLADISWYSIEEQLKMAGIYNRQNLDLLHVPHFNVPILYRKKFIVTIHDLIHHDFAQESATTKNPLIYKLKRSAYKYTIKNAVKKSQKIIVPSKYVKEQLLSKFKIDSTKIKVIYEAAEDEYYQDKKAPHALLKKYKISEPFVIYVGNAYPHKNLDSLLEAINSFGLKNLSGIKLVIVSSRDVFTRRLEKTIKSMNLENHVVLTGYIPANELSQIFKRALAYIFPSLSEGFGIPGLNAMAAKIPVISSNIPTLKEIYQEGAYYFNPKDAQEIKEKLKEVVEKPQLAKYLIDKGNKQVTKYSWKKMAIETLDLYKSL